jgi:hypothetical protein
MLTFTVIAAAYSTFFVGGLCVLNLNAVREARRCRR